MKSVWLKPLIFTLLLMPALAYAKAYQEGKSYTRLAKDIPTQSGNKVEVLEFFWYGCPHCFQFEPTLAKWKKNIPENVHFVRVPAPLNPKWMVHTKTYYALEIMGLGEKYHEPIFQAMHVDRKKLFSFDAIADFLASQGVDKKAFTNTYNSFAVEMRARKAMQLGRSYRLSGVPMLTVNGKYVVSAEKAGSFNEMINITNFLITKEANASN